MSRFREYARYNSGTHFLDSGSAYGRHHEKPPIEVSVPMVSWDKSCNDVPATIETSLFLEVHMGVNEYLHAAFDRFCEDHPNGSWFEVSEMFLEHMGYHRHAKDNVYNGENDFSQVFVWEVWTNRDDEPDWMYPEGSFVTVFFIHTGCDVRGGYSPPVFCTEVKSDCEYPLPLDFSCGYHVKPEIAVADDQTPLPHIPQPRTIEEKLEEVNNQCCIGYSSYPLAELENYVEEWMPSEDLQLNQKRVRIDDAVCIVTAYCAEW